MFLTRFTLALFTCATFAPFVTLVTNSAFAAGFKFSTCEYEALDDSLSVKVKQSGGLDLWPNHKNRITVTYKRWNEVRGLYHSGEFTYQTCGAIETSHESVRCMLKETSQLQLVEITHADTYETLSRTLIFKKTGERVPLELEGKCWN